MFEDLEINGLKLVAPKKHDDDRGYFSETYNSDTWRKAGLNYVFVQDNHSLSRDIGTVRGLHFQTAPFEQDKLVRVARGCILDVAVDLRRSSPTFKKYFAVELSHTNWRQLFIPSGFAHGFITLEPNTEVIYKVTNFYSVAHEFGIVWNDPEINVQWPADNFDIILSEKDQNLPPLRDVKNLFP